MFVVFKRGLADLWQKMLHTSDVNSRVVFLAHTGTAVFGTIALVIAFIVAKDKTGYDSMILALNGASGVGGAVGRYITKKGGSDSADPTLPANPDSPDGK